MVSRWDRSMKRLFALAAQDLITFVLPQARFLQHASGEFVLKSDPSLPGLGLLAADTLSACSLEGETLLIHLEFQSRADNKMAHRLLMYNILADERYGSPVLSCVIYLRRCGVVATPYRRQLPNATPVYDFYFQVIKLWELPAQELLARQLPGLLPLLPLSREGRSRQVIRTMIERLQQARQFELLEVGLLLASLAWADAPASERQWLQEQIQMLTEFLQELKQTDAARALIEEGLRQGIEQGRQEGRQEGLQQGRQEGLQQGRQEGLQQGRQEGLQQGRQEGLHKARQRLLTTVSARFPHLYGLAAQVTAHLNDLDSLLLLLEQVYSAPTTEHLRALLLAQLPDSAGPPPTDNGSQP
uniref:Rpn family recombination-promoting nuclease/putative transposase n=1 Tax=Thermogemmatispora argillosa TaxID=2045280 RepID=A0A455T3K8_9CHLR|nr:hypothetical protein KTA_12740 [Thermogemmatispora argillosa]